MDYDILGYRGLQGTHMDAVKPPGIFWTKFVDLAHSAAVELFKNSGVPVRIPIPLTGIVYYSNKDKD